MKNELVKKRLLILGGDGMAGSMMSSYLRELKKYEVFHTTRRQGKNGVYFDGLQANKELANLLTKLKPDYVINCIGLLNQAAEDNKKDAIFLNSYLPHLVNTYAEKNTFKLIHISTDCVFDGLRGSYKIDDFPDEKGFYGRTKALGEIVGDYSVTLRTSIIGPDPNEQGIGLLNWFMKSAESESEINGYARVAWTGVTTLQLAKIVQESIVDSTKNLTGLVHVVNSDKISKYKLLNLFKDNFKVEVDIKRDEKKVSDKSLITSHPEISNKIPSYEKMIEEMVNWVMTHPEDYPSYYFKKGKKA